MTLFYIFAAILLFGILITVHEAGHFFAARLTRIPVRVDAYPARGSSWDNLLPAPRGAAWPAFTATRNPAPRNETHGARAVRGQSRLKP